MQKLFTLTEKQWQTGISPSGHIEDGGILYQSIGVSPYVSTHRATIPVSGLLQATSAAVDVSDNVVDTIWSAILSKKDGFPYIFMQGNDGHFYGQNTLNDGPPTDLRSGTPITDQASGLAVYQSVGAARSLYYAQKTKIGRWDIDGGDTYPTYWTDNYIGSGGTISTTAINSTDIHPMHNFGGSVWMGNGSSVAKITDNGVGAVTFDAAALDIPSDFIITSISDDGRYLVIAATKNTTGGSFWAFETSIFFWDLISDSWNREWKMTDAGIASVRNVNGLLFALGGFALYALDYSTPPAPIFLPGGNENISNIGVSPTHYGLTDIDGVLYWNADGVIVSFGSLIPGKPKAVFQPHVLPSTAFTGGILIAGTQQKLYASNYNDKFYYLSRATSGNTGVSAQTVYVPLAEKSQIQRIDVVFGTALASGDSLSISIQRDGDTSATSWGTASYAVHGAVRKVTLYNSANDVDFISLKFSFDAGNVKIKSVTVFGESMET